MSKRSAKFVSAIFASILAGTSFAAVAQDAAKEAAERAKRRTPACRGPKGPSPAGGHWYYRIDHATKRNCWYIGEDEEQVRARRTEGFSSPRTPAASDPASADAANAVSPQQSINARKSIADARAELTAPQARVEDLIEPQTTGAVPVASIANSQRAAAPDAPRHRPSHRAGRNLPASAHRAVRALPRPSHRKARRLKTRRPKASRPRTSKPTAFKPIRSRATARRRPGRARCRGLIAGKTVGIDADAAAGHGRCAGAGGHHRKSGFQVRPRAGDPAGSSRRSPCDLGFDPDRTVRRHRCSRTRTRRSGAAMLPPQHAPRDPRAPDDPERRVTEMLARLARSAQT